MKKRFVSFFCLLFLCLLLMTASVFCQPLQAVQRILREETRVFLPAQIDVEFTGNVLFTDEQLRGEMTLLNNPPAEGWKLMELRDVVNADVQGNLRFWVGRFGHLCAVIDEPKIEVTGNRVKVIVKVAEGARYRIGEISVKGAKLFSEKRIIELTGLRTGELITTSAIHEGVYQRVRDAYGEYGYMQASAEFIPEIRLPFPEAVEGIVDCTIEIEEMQQYHIRKIEIAGLDDQAARMARQLLLLREGQVYNKKLFYQSLQRLNESGLFESSEPANSVDAAEPITEKSVTFKTPRKSTQIDLVFSLRMKSRR